MTKAFITQRVALFIKLIEPARFIVLAFFRVVAAEQAVVKLVVIANNQAGIGVVAHVFVLHAVVFKQVANHAKQECGVRARANWRVEIGHGGATVETWVNHHHGSVIFGLRFNHPLEAHRMRFRRVAAHDQHHVGVFDIHPVIGHRAAAKGWRQRRNGRPVAQSRLAVDGDHAQAAGKFTVEDPGFITGSGGTEHAGRGPAINGQPVGVLLNKVRVAVVFH